MKVVALGVIHLLTVFTITPCFSENVTIAQIEENYFFEQGYVPDAFEYHLPAVNFALHGRFPYYGFISSIQDYCLVDKADSVGYYEDIRKAGVIVFPSKPPLYSFLLGLAYKMWGVRPITAMFFNLWCMVITCSLMPLAGFAIWRFKGLLSGILAMVVFLFSHKLNNWNFDAEIFTVLLVTVAFALGSWATAQSKASWYFIFGMSMGLLMLCKGYFIFCTLFVVVYVLLKLRKETVTHLKMLLFFIVGNFIFLLPWMLYINPLLQRNIPDRLLFSEKLKATTPKVLLNSHKDIFNAEGKLRPEVMENVNKFHEYQQARENGFVFISNQYGDYNILNVHNEYCGDGDFHSEWRIIKSSFYNQHTDKTKHQKLWLFYTTYPLLGMKIMWAKLTSTMAESSGILFYLSLLSILLMATKKQFSETLVIGSFFLFNVLIVIIMLYGDIRFVQTVYPVALMLLFIAAANYLQNIFSIKIENSKII